MFQLSDSIKIRCNSQSYKLHLLNQENNLNVISVSVLIEPSAI